jgi:hypothetical protein
LSPAASDGVVLAGDFNIDMNGDRPHLDQVLTNARASKTLPTIVSEKGCEENSMHCTMSRDNKLFGRDGSALFGPALFKGCQKTYMSKQRCDCCSEAYFDYVVPIVGFRMAEHASMKVLPMTAPAFSVCMRAALKGYVDAAGCKSEYRWDIDTLSDHYAVLGQIRFKSLD